ncbi:MAG TPA: MgtC/SapB family protein [Candidatus Paceibacterota bacterium]|nr:MgtC/SapB family protein [Candidatus Paceibacterota bacterium]
MEFFVSYFELFLSLLMAVVLGATLGIERSLAGKTAGMRTYSLVSLGSALFVTISQMVIATSSSYMTGLDPLRMASQIIVGIGFIGAGLVVLRGSQLTGITTAAGVWVSAGVGMACGFGLYPIALFATGLTLFVFTVLWIIERDYLQSMLVKNICPATCAEEIEGEKKENVAEEI